MSKTPATRLVVNSTKPRSLTCLATSMPAFAVSAVANAPLVSAWPLLALATFRRAISALAMSHSVVVIVSVSPARSSSRSSSESISSSAFVTMSSTNSLAPFEISCRRWTRCRHPACRPRAVAPEYFGSCGIVASSEVVGDEGQAKRARCTAPSRPRSSASSEPAAAGALVAGAPATRVKRLQVATVAGGVVKRAVGADGEQVQRLVDAREGEPVERPAGADLDPRRPGAVDR